jgi:hypothetical protein
MGDQSLFDVAVVATIRIDPAVLPYAANGALGDKV